MLQFKNSQLSKNMILISVKYGTLLGIASLSMWLLNFLILVSPHYSEIIVNFVTMGCLAIGYFYAQQKFRQRINSETLTPLDPHKVLSNREIEVFQELLSSKTNKEISMQLFIEISTLKSHINRIYKKTGVKTRIELRQTFLN